MPSSKSVCASLTQCNDANDKLLCRDEGVPVVPLTKEAIKSAQLTYEGSFKDPEVLKHWSGSGNMR